MGELNKIRVNGVWYDLRDEAAREILKNSKSGAYVQAEAPETDVIGTLWYDTDEEGGGEGGGGINLDTLLAHINNKENPHAVTATQVGADVKGSANAVKTLLIQHKNDTNNPHGLTASKIGADPAGSAAQALKEAKEYADSIGSSGNVSFGDLYVSGVLTDGTNNISVADIANKNDFLPLAGGTLAGDLIFDDQATQIKAYNIVLKNIENNNELSYPCMKLYQTGNKWVVSACDNEGVSKKEIFSIDLNTNIATFLDRPTVNGEKIALVSDFSGVFLTDDELPQDGVPLVNIFYFLGELSGEELTVTLPSDAVPGDMIYLSYSTGATQPNVTVVGDAIGLSNLTNLTYRSYELMGLWSGDVWLFVVREVGL